MTNSDRNPIGFYTTPRCEHGGEPFVKVNGRTLGGASSSGRHLVGSADLIVDCAANRWAYSPGGNMFTGTAFESLAPFFQTRPTTISLDWPDYGVVKEFEAPFWRELLRATKPDSHIVIACYGGHGRTGTVLASILACHGMDPTVAVKLVRDKHCHKAIESKSQMEYIYALVGATPPKDMMEEWERPVTTTVTGVTFGGKYLQSYDCKHCNKHYKSPGPCDHMHGYMSVEERSKNPPIP